MGVAGSGIEQATEDRAAWLVRRRVAVPESPRDYHERDDLLARCALTSRRLTLVMAPGGFGKTTLLAACARAARATGARVAWLTLGLEDGPEELDAYVACAFMEAGAELSADLSGVGSGRVGTDAVLRAVDGAERPWVLVLDEVENLASAESAKWVGHLLQGAPRGLHLAIACRALPGAMDAAVAAFASDAEIVAPEELLFGETEAARYLGFGLSRAKLAAAMRETWGWPIALQFARQEAAAATPGGAVVVHEVAENWIAGRFLRGVRQEERELLLDLGLFERFDAALAEDVLERPGAVDVITGAPWLAGLVARTGADYRLHPLIRRYAEARRRETPERYRVLQRRLAEAVAKRGGTIVAMGHAVAAGDAALAGRILAEAGGLAVWLRDGPESLIAANRMLTPAIAAANPRIALVRCAALAVAGDAAGARRAYADTAGMITAAAAGSVGFAAEACVARGMIARYGCAAVAAAETRELMAEVRRLAGLPTVEALVRATLEYGLAAYHGMRAEFDAVAVHGDRARALALRRSAYLAAATAFLRGQAAMAQGHVREALDWYREGRRAARRGAPGNRAWAAMAAVLRQEIEFERNRVVDDEGAAEVEGLVLRGGADQGCRAAAAALTIHRARGADRAVSALDVLDDLWERARRAELATLERQLAAWRVALLVEDGRPTEAERTWMAAELPVKDAVCVDLDRQSWREMEAVACARIALLGALGERPAARRLADAAVAAARERRLVRTALRALALRIALEEDAAGAVARRLVGSYLALCGDAGYIRPLVATGSAAARAVTAYLDEEPDGALVGRAELVLASMTRGPEVIPVIRGRQREVLQLLATRSDRDIAAALGLTVDGVRYHLRKIFRMLGVRARDAAVGRARALGILDPD